MPFRFKIIILSMLFGGLSYILGSINFAILTTKKSTGNDIRALGSGNAGMTNVMRSAGFGPGMITFIGDLGKAVASVVLGKYLLTDVLIALAPTTALDPTLNYTYVQAMAPIYGGTICGLCCLAGHIFPMFFGFKGGKGVMTFVGTMFVLDWRIAILVAAVFITVFLISRIVSLSSITAAISYPIITYLVYSERYDFLPIAQTIINAKGSEYHPFFMSLVWFETGAAAIFAVIILITHRENIKRLLRGKEKPLKIRRSKKIHKL